MQLPKDGEYYATMTLLGGEPDVNRRIIYQWPSDRQICVFNQQMDAWTAEDERRFQLVLKALRADQAACV